MRDLHAEQRETMRMFLSAAFIIIGCGLFLTGCGKKGPPVPPGQIRPNKVVDLKKEITENTLTLSWTVPEGSKWKGTVLSGFSVYRSKDSLDGSACADCPLKFEKIADVSIAENRLKGVTQYHDILEKEYRYAYKVIGYTEKNVMSDDSNIIKFIFNGGVDEEDDKH